MTTATAVVASVAAVTKETDLFGCALKFDCSLTVTSEQQQEKKKKKKKLTFQCIRNNEP